MYLIICNDENRILAIADEVTYQDNGYPTVGSIAYYNVKEVVEVDEVPEGVEAFSWAYDGDYTQIVIPEPVDDPTEIIDILTGVME